MLATGLAEGNTETCRFALTEPAFQGHCETHQPQRMNPI